MKFDNGPNEIVKHANDPQIPRNYIGVEKFYYHGNHYKIPPYNKVLHQTIKFNGLID